GDSLYDILTNIFNDDMWGKRDYGNGQLSWVKLVDETNYNFQTKLYIEWTINGFYNILDYNCYTRTVKFRFLTNNALF
ncbi:14880_t:CDS:1, partial [Dentiscutata heterogama]